MQQRGKNVLLFKNSIFLKQEKFDYKALALKAIRKFIPEMAKEKIKRNKYSSGVYDKIKGLIIDEFKSPRVFIKKGISRLRFFEILHDRNVEYVILRWWQNFPNISEGSDMDILIKDEHRILIDDLLVFHDNGTNLKCDIYTITGINYGSRGSIPYFPSNLSHTLIETRKLHNGIFVPSPLLYFASLAYHAVFHKGILSGLSGFQERSSELKHDYPNILKDMSVELGLNLEITVQGLYDWLKEHNFAPADDTLAKLVKEKPELNFLQKSLYSDIRGGDLLVYIVRERLFQDGLLLEFKEFLENKFHFDVIDVRILNSEERTKCKTQIRGGKWDKGQYQYSGGPPAVLIVAYDYHPVPPENIEKNSLARLTNGNNLAAKYDFREQMFNSTQYIGKYNGVHSADNEHEAWLYISMCGESYREYIFNQVEMKRKRYAHKWSVIKTLSSGKISKVELIKYGQQMAIKKTFRPGKEKFFERELYAVKELSKEYSFIPPLLEDGDGFVIIPFFDNNLDNLQEMERKNLISSKMDEIIEVEVSLRKKGLKLINFNPDSLIITPENKLICTGYSFLQQIHSNSSISKNLMDNETSNVNQIDLSLEDENNQNSFENIWFSYLGSQNVVGIRERN